MKNCAEQANEASGSAPGVLDLIAKGEAADFGRDVFPAMLGARRRLQAYVIEPAGFCLGLDTPQAFAEMLRGDNFGKMLIQVGEDPTRPS